MARLTRAARGAVIALVLALLWAAPAAAAQPTRTVFHRTGGVIPGDQTGCGFAVSVTYPQGATTTVTDFSDGTEVTDVHIPVRVITNVATGATFVSKEDSHDVEWFDAATGVIHGITNGRQAASFLPGDVSPYGGIVQAPGLGVEFVGTQWYAYDTTINQLTQFAYQGAPITDICALLS